MYNAPLNVKLTSYLHVESHSCITPIVQDKVLLTYTEDLEANVLDIR